MILKKSVFKKTKASKNLLEHNRKIKGACLFLFFDWLTCEQFPQLTGMLSMSRLVVGYCKGRTA